jgi:hypothetical protein
MLARHMGRARAAEASERAQKATEAKLFVPGLVRRRRAADAVTGRVGRAQEHWMFRGVGLQPGAELAGMPGLSPSRQSSLPQIHHATSDGFPPRTKSAGTRLIPGTFTMIRALVLTFFFAVLVASSSGATVEAEGAPFAVRGVFSVGGATFVCLHANAVNRNKWVLADDWIAGWLVHEIVFASSSGQVVLESAAGTTITLAIGPEHNTTLVPAKFDLAWIKSPANPMRRGMAQIPAAWYQHWPTMSVAEHTAIRAWYFNQGWDVAIGSDGQGMTFTSFGSSVPGNPAYLRERKQREQAFEQSLSAIQRAAFDTLMGALMRANEVVRADAPPPPAGEETKQPTCAQWREFVATLTDAQAARFHELYPGFDATGKPAIDPDTIVPENTPTGQVQQALAALRDAKSYSWETICQPRCFLVAGATPPTAPALTPPPVMTDEWMQFIGTDPEQRLRIGRFVRDDFIHVRRMANRTAAWIEVFERPVEDLLVLTPEGWLTHDECWTAFTHAGAERVAFGGVELPRNECYHLAIAAQSYFDFLAENDVAQWIDRARFFRVVGDCYVAELKRRFFETPHAPIKNDKVLPTAFGLLAVRLVDGRMTEFHVLTRNPAIDEYDNACEFQFEQHTRIRNHNATVIDLPDAVRRKFGL